MKFYEKPTKLDEQVATETKTVFAEHLNQFKGICDALHNVENHLTTIGNGALKAALLSPGHIIQTNDGAEWRHDIDLMKNISVCHRRIAGKIEFAVVECLPLQSREMTEVLNSGHSVRDVLRKFTHDQRQVLNLWKNDATAQIQEHLEEKYPHQDMSHVVESFEIKLARAISQRSVLAQNQSRGVRI